MDENQKFKVTVSSDLLEAYIELNKPGIDMSKEDLDEIVNEVKSQNITYNFDEVKTKEKVLTATGLEKILIAEGKAPQNGEDGYLKFLTEEKKDKTPVMLEDGTADYYNLDLITNIEKNTPIAEVVPETKGTPGYNVFGEEIPSTPGKEAKIPNGKNIYFNPEDARIYSEIDGKLSLANDSINVFELLEIDGDVDFSSGNIDFIGTVVVNGSVRDGFEVRAQGDVTINGLVDSSTIICSGNLTVSGGIQGRNKGIIDAKGTVSTRYIENCKVSSTNVVVKDAIMHSEIYAKDKVTVLEGKGLIVGGLIRAGKQISAKVIGSNLATRTSLEVGVDPELREKCTEVANSLQEKKSSAKKAQQALKLLNTKQQMPGGLSAEQQELYKKFHSTLNFLRREIEDLTDQYNDLTVKLKASKGVIEANERVFPGVKIIIGSKSRNISDITSSSTFYLGYDGEVSIK
ncbi:FapA family protein [Proteinivorax hydrogeniformans]|uniref:FapA family protein n=1 Tax=Proteinivorax hydrogeniformans TaxID=1826727 RepID=A0AAU8HP22_9FIRM